MSETLVERLNRHAADLDAEVDGLVMPGSRYAARIAELEAERTRVREAVARDNEEIMQALGRALGYPKLADDQKNFPGSTDADGVCVGDHVAVTLAEEAARKIAALEAEVERLREALEPFAWVGQFLFARALPDATPMVTWAGLGSPAHLTRGHFKAAHLALLDDESRAALGRAAP